jgi:uncharacterized protein
MTGLGDRPHLPRRAEIDRYGNGGFRFADMSHRGSLLCLPDGMWAWPVARPEEITTEQLAPFLERAGQLDFVILGTGREPWIVPEPLRAPFRAARLSLDIMTTPAAVSTYNVMVAEDRRIGAGLIAVD